MDFFSIDFIVTNGIFAALFIWLLKTTNDRNERRENDYRECMREYRKIMASMGENLARMSKDIEEINYKIDVNANK